MEIMDVKGFTGINGYGCVKKKRGRKEWSFYILSEWCSYSFIPQKRKGYRYISTKLIKKVIDENISVFSTQNTLRGKQTPCLLQKEKHVTGSGSGSLKLIKLFIL